MSYDKICLMGLGFIAVVLILAMNIWMHREKRKRKLTYRQLEEELRNDLHSWWP
jgi:hypothetical protein